MVRRICDMCGKEIEPAKTVRIRAEGIPIGERLYNTPLCASCDYDLCAECFERAVNEKDGLTINAKMSDEAAEMIAKVIDRNPEPYSQKRGGTK